MKIKEELPPYGLMKKCSQMFDLSEAKPIFTFGDTIYNPHKMPIDEYMISHESVHKIQQGDEPEKWWDDYLLDKQFRLEQELQAYRVQFRVFKDFNKDRNSQAKYLYALANDLASGMYGRITTHSKAFKAIKDGVVSAHTK